MSVGKMLGLTKGVVIDIDDPSGYKRVRVRIPQLHGAITEDFYPNKRASTINRTKDENIPWAEVNYPYGSDICPEVNQVVLVGFISGDANQPVVLGWLGYEYPNKEESMETDSLSKTTG